MTRRLALLGWLAAGAVLAYAIAVRLAFWWQGHRDELTPSVELGGPIEIRWSHGEWTRGTIGSLGWDPKREAYTFGLRDVVRSSDDEPGGGFSEPWGGL
jgi:hypothetical protein